MIASRATHIALTETPGRISVSVDASEAADFHFSFVPQQFPDERAAELEVEIERLRADLAQTEVAYAQSRKRRRRR